MKIHWLLVGLLAGAAIPAEASSSTFDATEAVPLDRTVRAPTVHLQSITYNARAGAYVVRATIALSNVQGTTEQRATRSLEAKVTYLESGASRTSASTTKLSEIAIVSQDAKRGIAVVEIKINGGRADNMDAATVRMQVVGANPTPHP